MISIAFTKNVPQKGSIMVRYSKRAKQAYTNKKVVARNRIQNKNFEAPLLIWKNFAQK
jgi:hypothetical protein